MKILVTGGAGYKGTVLSKALLDKGHDVTIFDNFMYGYEPVLHLATHPNFNVIKEDIRNVTEEHLKGFDVIFHLAGLSGYPACEANPHSATLINAEASKRLNGLLGKDQMLIYASTTSVYGNMEGDVCDEESAVKPASLYAITKYEAEKAFLERENSIALRFATVFGVSPKMRTDLLVNDFTYKAVTERSIVLFESKSKRTFLHIQDAIDSYLLSLEKFSDMKGNVFNVGSESLNHSKREIADTIAKYTKCEIVDSSKLQDYDVRDFTVSFEKIKKHGFVPQKSLDGGIAELVKLYQFYRVHTPYKII